MTVAHLDYSDPLRTRGDRGDWGEWNRAQLRFVELGLEQLGALV